MLASNDISMTVMVICDKSSTESMAAASISRARHGVVGEIIKPRR